MNPLRHAHRLARFMLAWFALSLAVAVASPLVHPQQVELLCSAGGQVKAVVHTASGDTLELGAGHLDCPLCIPAGAPGPLPLLALAGPAPSFVLDLTAPAAPAAATALPWQARAPPVACS
ncbi:MAG: hypothetical protein LCH72_04860 [Proteobacteria bacterium]|nr:hypothetical protein [Burkholderiales bacterium]MCA0310002.1 hypothetical protein [Pseudomonadota bacterium]